MSLWVSHFFNLESAANRSSLSRFSMDIQRIVFMLNERSDT
ncbi:hypothetical protein M5D96_013363 [Drosophila gunungcola]|uniref:Uncharacterized protein n=1 Tax=Drosophila gunungcola TaxID=103775 RepID=A0A9P9YCA2_9MUSC|nr:hypothetical protein M5D96_013363 [Drosophila gunungcola]